MPLLSFVALFAARAHAADILIPEATPESLDDFSVAYMVYDLVVNELGNGMYRVDDGDRIRVWAGKDAEGCYDTPECPGNLWGRTDARLALVMGVGHTDTGLSVTVKFYDAEHVDPIRELHDQVPSGAELAFAKDVAMAVSETIAGVPKRASATSTKDGGRKEAAAPVVVDAGPDKEPAKEPTKEADGDSATPTTPGSKGGKAQRAPKEEPLDEEEELARPSKRPEEHDDTQVTKDRKPSRIAEEEEDDSMPDFTSKKPVAEEPEEEVDAAERTVDETDLPSTGELAKDAAAAEAERKKMGIPAGAYERYAASGLSQKEWMQEARVRHLGVFVEAAAGYAIGDTDRAYGVWVDLEDQGDGNFVSTASSTWEGSGKGADGGGGLAVLGAVGLTATWWFEVSVAGGIQQGKKYLEAGWECSACDSPTEEVPFDPVSGTQFWIQPKVRFIPVPTGILKPYVLVSGDFALYDGFVPDTEVVDFPNAEGGLNAGVGVGAGIFVDAIPHLSFFAEVPYSITLSPLWRSYDDPGVATQPEGIPGQGGLLRLLGGVSAHF